MSCVQHVGLFGLPQFGTAAQPPTSRYACPSYGSNQICRSFLEGLAQPILFSSKLLERGFKRGRDAKARKIAGLKLTDSEREAAIKGLGVRKAGSARGGPEHDA